MTISIQTPDTEVVWQRMVRQLQRAEGKAGAAFLFLPPQPSSLPHQCRFTVVIQISSVHQRQQVCFSEGPGQAKDYSYTKHRAELFPLYSYLKKGHFFSQKKKKKTRTKEQLKSIKK